MVKISKSHILRAVGLRNEVSLNFGFSTVAVYFLKYHNIENNSRITSLFNLKKNLFLFKKTSSI